MTEPIPSPEPYRQSVASWPTEAPTADEWLRYIATNALAANGAAWARGGASFISDSPDNRAARTAAILTSIRLHDQVVMMKALMAVDPAAADEVARRCWLAAEAGDSYGEWTWQWVDELGLDAERIHTEATAATVAVILTEATPAPLWVTDAEVGDECLHYAGPDSDDDHPFIYRPRSINDEDWADIVETLTELGQP